MEREREMMQQDLLWNNTTRTSKSAPCSPIKPIVVPPPHRSASFHIVHKVPVGDTPYVKAKRVQLVEKDPDRAIALFWAAINAGDRVDSALKDMAIVMKQQNRAEEAIEAIKSLRNRCTDQAQESLDNILLDLFKRCGRLDDQITLLRHKLNLIQQGLAFNGRRTKTARSQGKKFQVSVDQEATRLLGNLGWALMQQDNYIEAEAAYRRALLIGPDNNKMCNLGICLMKQGRISEAKATLKQVKPAVADGPRGVDSHLKAFERAQEMLRDLESKMSVIGAEIGEWRSDQRLIFDATAFLGSIWQPQPCLDSSSSSSYSSLKPLETFSDENLKPDSNLGNSLNVFAPPFYSKQVHDPLGNLKRTRSVATEKKKPPLAPPPRQQHKEEPKGATRRSLFFDQTGTTTASSDNKWIVDLLPDNKAFEEAIVAAVLAPILEAADATIAKEGDTTTDKKSSSSPICEEKVGKRLRVFQDITQKSLIRRSPRGG